MSILQKNKIVPALDYNDQDSQYDQIGPGLQFCTIAASIVAKFIIWGFSLCLTSGPDTLYLQIEVTLTQPLTTIM